MRTRANDDRRGATRTSRRGAPVLWAAATAVGAVVAAVTWRPAPTGATAAPSPEVAVERDAERSAVVPAPVSVARSGGGGATTERRAVEPRPGAASRAPRPAARYFGRLLADTGPIAGHRIRRGVVTDGEGYFVMKGRGDVLVDVEGFAQIAARLTDQHASHDRALEIRLRRLATIRGTCVDAHGERRLSGVSVLAIATGTTPTTDSNGYVGIESSGFRSTAIRDGAFEMAGVQPGVPVALTALVERLPLTSLVLDPLEEGETRVVELTLPAVGCVRGTLLDHDGAPMARQRIHLDRAEAMPLGTQSFSPESEERVLDDHWTGDRGEFWMCGIPSGRWALVLDTGTTPFLGHVFDLEGGDVEITVRLPTPAVLSGVVRDATGRPSPWFDLEIDSQPFGEGPRLQSPDPWMEGGKFVLTLPRKPHRVRAVGRGLRSPWVEVTPPARVVLTMPPTRRLTGRLGMEPRPRAREPIRFAFRPAETVFGHTRRSGDGTFALDGFPQGAFTLQVTDVRARRVGRIHVGPGSGETHLGTIGMNEGCLVTFTGGLWSRPLLYAADVDGLWLDVVGSLESRVLPRGILRLVPLDPPSMHDLDEAAERARDLPTDLVFDLRGRDELTIDLDELAPDGD